MVKTVIPYSRQTISPADIRAVTDVLKSGWLTTGPLVEQFESAVAKLVNTRYAVAVSNGTAALHLACMTLGLHQGDEVITTPYTFAATANCALYCGATPVFVDIDPNTLNIDISQLEQKITKNTRAIIAVDFGGLPADWKQLKRLARTYKLSLLDDGAHSFGGYYQHKRLGPHVDMTCFSFHPVKTITTGEGGMVVTNKKHFADRLRILRTHGVFRDGHPWHYEMRELGFNYRLTDIQSALGLAQLKHLDVFLDKRRSLAKRYIKKLSGLPYVTLPLSSDESAWHLFPLRMDFNVIGKTKEQLFAWMSHHGITLQVHYIPVHLHPYYRKQFGYKRGDFPVAENVYDQEVSLPLYPTLTFKEQDLVIELLSEFLAVK